MAGVDRKQHGRCWKSASPSCARRGAASRSSGAAAVRVTPKPASAPMVLIGGSTEKAAKHAAKLHAGFFPAIGDQALADVYTANASGSASAAASSACRTAPASCTSEDATRLAAHRAARRL